MPYEYLLRAYGLRKLLSKQEKNVDNDGNEMKQVIVVIDEDSGIIKENIVKTPKKIYEKKMPMFIINNFYRIIVILLLLFECVYPIISAGITGNIHYFTSSFFSYMFLTQYIFGIMLHNNAYYEIIYQKIKNDKYYVYISTVYLIGLFVAVILAVVPLFTTGYIMDFYYLVNNNTAGNYTGNNTAGHVMLLIYMVPNRIYSYGIFFSNAIIFALLMYSHCDEIKTYKKSLELMVDDSIMDINISTTIKDYTEIKGRYYDTVKNSNNIFASAIVFGVLGCYFTLININTKYNNIYSYIDSVCALLVQLIYIGAVCVISRTVNDMRTLIDSPKFVSIFLNRSNFASFKGDVYENYAREPNKSPKKEILKESISPRKESDKNINVSMQKHTNNQDSKQENSIPSLKSSSSIRQINNKIILETSEKIDNSNDKNKKIDFMKNVILRNMVTSTENGINLDWIILYSKLSDPWERFEICGFEINDSQLFQQLISMAIGLLGVLEISKLI